MQAAAAIRHPNVIPIFHAGEEQGLLFVSMQFVNGADLGRILRSGAPRARPGGLAGGRPRRWAGRRAPARDRAPRRQTGERADRVAGRDDARVPLGLRARQEPPRRLDDAHRRDPRDARLRRAGTARGGARRRPHRRLCARLSAVSRADGPDSVPAADAAKILAHLRGPPRRSGTSARTFPWRSRTSSRARCARSPTAGIRGPLARPGRGRRRRGGRADGGDADASSRRGGGCGVRVAGRRLPTISPFPRR